MFESNQQIQDLLNFEFWNNTLQNYLIAIIVFLLIFIGSYILRFYLIRRIKKLTKKSKTEADDILIKTLQSIGSPFYLIFSLNVASKFLNVPDFYWTWLNGFTLTILTFYLVPKLHIFLNYIIHGYVKSKQKIEDEDNAEVFDTSLLNLISTTLGVFLWVAAFIIVSQAFEVNVTALVGGLGITGIAVAFALQNILADIFASIAIFFDKPFKIGDFVILDENHMGSVEHVGIKSTRIRSISGELLVISNKELSESRISNYREMNSRRAVFSFGVEYQTTVKQLRQIPDICKKIISDIKICTFDRAHFQKFGDSSLDFEVVYYVNSSDYNTYMDVQQKINLELKENFEQSKIEFAYPTQTVLLKK